MTGLLLCVALLLPTFLPVSGQAAQVTTDGEQPGVTLTTTLADGLIFRVNTPTYAIENVLSGGESYQRLVAEGTQQRQAPGQAQLPFYPIVLGVPPDAQVQVEIVADRSELLRAAVRLPLAEQPVSNAGELAPGEMAIPVTALSGGLSLAEENQLAAANQPVRVGETAWLRSQKIVRLEVYPFEQAASGEAFTWRQQLEVHVRFIRPAGAALAEGPSGSVDEAAFEPVYQAALLNYAQARAWRSGAPIEDAPAAVQAPFSGTRYRIAIDKDGLYRLDYATLQAAGLNLANLDATKLHLTNQGEEVAILVENKDGNPQRLSSGEGIVFYGQRFYGERMAERFSAEDDAWLSFTTQNPAGNYIQWKPQQNAVTMERYTNTNVYWLYAENTPGLRMETRNGSPDAGTTPQATFRSMVRSEQQNLWKTSLLNGEDVFFWLYMATSNDTPQTNASVTIHLPDVAAVAGSAIMRSAFAASANGPSNSPDHQIRMYINDPARSQTIEYKWDGVSRFLGQESIDQTRLVNGDNLVDLSMFDTEAMISDGVYLNWIEFEYERLFKAVDHQLVFNKVAGAGQKFQVSGFGSGERLALDVTDPLQPVLITGSAAAADTLTFQDTSSAAGVRIAATPWEVAGAQLSAYTAPDLSAGGDYVIITHSSLVAAAQELAEYRESQDSDVRVVDIADLYNLFTDGIYHPLAIKEFLRYADQTWTQPPAYVVLIGDGHWNFHKNSNFGTKEILIPPYLNWVDPWMGEVDSANLLAAIRGSDPLPDVHIARMPVNTPAELHAIVAKVKTYEAAPGEDWQRNNIFLADNTPDGAGNFVAYSEGIIAAYVTGRMNPVRFYLDDYTDQDNCGPNSGASKCANATAGFIDTLNTQGGALLNYVGHAGMNFWTSEVIFSDENVAALDNGDRLPVLLSLTCWDGYWIHPNETWDILARTGPSLSEMLLRADQAGVIASFSPTGLGLSTGHDNLQRGFYDQVLLQQDWLLGPAAMSAKLRLYSTGANYDLLHTFTIFGDPALEIAHFSSLYLPVAQR